MRPILSCQDFAWTLGIRLTRLRTIADSIGKHYQHTVLWDAKKQKNRQLKIPDNELKDIQRRIKSRILDQHSLSPMVHGGVQGKSPRSNAEQHLGQPCVVNVDVRDFFPNVRHYIVYRMFRREFGFGRDVASLITKLTTYKSQLPQGTPTSTSIANLLLASPVDEPIERAAEHDNCRVTRFVDDFTFSGEQPQTLITPVAKMLSKRRLPIWRKKAKFQSRPKLKITPRSQCQQVTGLVVNSISGPSVPRKKRDEIRAAIFQLRGGPAESVPERLASIRGRIAHVRRFNQGSARRMEIQLRAIADKAAHPAQER